MLLTAPIHRHDAVRETAVEAAVEAVCGDVVSYIRDMSAQRDTTGNTGWSILAGELRIPRRTSIAAHRMIIVADPAGRAVRQINGLASWYDRAGQCWRHKPIGYLPSDRLRGYDTRTHPRTFLPINGADRLGWLMAPALESGAARVLAAGLTAEQVEQTLAPGLAALSRINALNKGPEGGAGLPYPFLGFGPNSNAFFSTLLRAMALDEPRFARPATLTPGAGVLLLPEREVSEIAARARSAPSGREGGRAMGQAVSGL